MQAVPHDDHPGQRGDARLLEVLLRVGVGVAVRVVVLGVVVVQDVVVVMVMVVQAVGLAHRVVEVRVTLVLAVLCAVGGGGGRGGGCLRRQHHLLLLRHAVPQPAHVVGEYAGAVGLHIWRTADKQMWG